MCGIAGLSWRDEGLVRRMCRAIAHRGPDQNGVYLDDQVSLGHLRLSIIDLSEAGRQPMCNEDGSVWVVYNGEIYNFADVRRWLEARGHRFRSQTDTEVIVHAFEEEGVECVHRFNGMFAFAVWDRKQRALWLVRDRLGIKPLYYWHKGEKFGFASEIKALVQIPELDRTLNPAALYHYVGYEFVPAPDTMFASIRKLPPGHILRFQNGKVEVERYWDLRFRDEGRPRVWYEAQLRERLEESVRKRLIADVPLGVFLSGGLDSSTVVAMMSRLGVSPLKTFSLGYEDPSFSELDHAQVVSKAFGTEHHELMIDPITPELIETAVWHLDEPMTDLSTIPFYLIAKKAREHVTVCLSGEGGDEVLVGYDRFKASQIHQYYRLLPAWIRRGVVAPLVKALPDQRQKKGPVNMLKRFVEGGLLPEEALHMRWQYFGAAEEEAGLFGAGVLNGTPRDPFAPIRAHAERCRSNRRLDREVYVDLCFTMPDSVLMKVDKMSMAHALEVRVPFLDYEVVEFCAGIPPRMKLEGLTTKSVLRSAMKGILPDSIAGRGKQGYSFPIKNWLRAELREYMQDTLGSSPIVREAFEPAYVRRLMDDHLAQRANHNHVLWALINVAVWHKTFLAARPGAEADGCEGATAGAGGAMDYRRIA